ncbi:hypothetical protein MRX96_050110 [Rhipicephalus microplus]
MTTVNSTDLTTTTVEPTESMGTSTASSPPASNTSTVTEATTEPVFPAQPPMTPFPVVRVFGTATNESQPLPADGVCDYNFYDGIYDTGPFDTLYSPHFSAPVEHVLSHASLHSVTEYGLSFAYRNASQVARDLEIPETELDDNISALFGDGIGVPSVTCAEPRLFRQGDWALLVVKKESSGEALSTSPNAVFLWRQFTGLPLHEKYATPFPDLM